VKASVVVAVRSAGAAMSTSANCVSLSAKTKRRSPVCAIELAFSAVLTVSSSPSSRLTRA
jgi:hypothetical protein